LREKDRQVFKRIEIAEGNKELEGEIKNIEEVRLLEMFDIINAGNPRCGERNKRRRQKGLQRSSVFRNDRDGYHNKNTNGEQM
jgi:hypothetical protein